MAVQPSHEDGKIWTDVSNTLSPSVSVTGSPAGHAEHRLAWRRDLRKRCLTRPVRSKVRWPEAKRCAARMGGLIGYASFSPNGSFPSRCCPSAASTARELAGQAFSASRLTCPR